MKPLEDFGPNKRTKDGRTFWCRPCINEHQRAYRKTPKGRAGRAAAYHKWATSAGGRETQRELNRKYRESPPGRARSLLSDAARRRPVEVSLEWVVARLERGVCEATGLKFDFAARTDGGHQNPYAPSLDRKDPAQNYTEENTQVVILAYNFAKGQLQDSAAREVIKRMAAGL